MYRSYPDHRLQGGKKDGDHESSVEGEDCSMGHKLFQSLHTFKSDQDGSETSHLDALVCR